MATLVAMLVVIIAVLLTALAALYLRKSFPKAALCAAPLLLFMAFYYNKAWHISNFYFLAITLLMIFRPEADDKKKLNISLSCVFSAILALQCVFAFGAVRYEAGNSYGYPKEVHSFVQKYVDEGKSISGFDYSAVSILPYFESNIYENWDKNKSYFIWAYNDGYNDFEHAMLSSSYEKLLTIDTDIIVSKSFNTELFDFSTKYPV